MCWDFRGTVQQAAERVFLLLLDKFLARSVNVSANSGRGSARRVCGRALSGAAKI